MILTMLTGTKVGPDDLENREDETATVHEPSGTPTTGAVPVKLAFLPPPGSGAERISIDRIDHTLRPASEVRTRVNWVLVEQYIEEYEQLPAVKLVYDEAADTYWTGDGRHRIEAVRTIGYTSITAFVTPGTYLDAFAIACNSNNVHGLRATKGDKHLRVMFALAHPEMGLHPTDPWTQSKIATACGVSQGFVSKLDARGSTYSGNKSTGEDGEFKTKGKDGKSRRRYKKRREPEQEPEPAKLPESGTEDRPPADEVASDGGSASAVPPPSPPPGDVADLETDASDARPTSPLRTAEADFGGPKADDGAENTPPVSDRPPVVGDVSSLPVSDGSVSLPGSPPPGNESGSSDPGWWTAETFAEVFGEVSTAPAASDLSAEEAWAIAKSTLDEIRARLKSSALGVWSHYVCTYGRDVGRQARHLDDRSRRDAVGTRARAGTPTEVEVSDRVAASPAPAVEVAFDTARKSEEAPSGSPEPAGDLDSTEIDSSVPDDAGGRGEAHGGPDEVDESSISMTEPEDLADDDLDDDGAMYDSETWSDEDRGLADQAEDLGPAGGTLVDADEEIITNRAENEVRTPSASPVDTQIETKKQARDRHEALISAMSEDERSRYVAELRRSDPSRIPDVDFGGKLPPCTKAIRLEVIRLETAAGSGPTAIAAMLPGSTAQGISYIQLEKLKAKQPTAPKS